MSFQGFYDKTLQEVVAASKLAEKTNLLSRSSQSAPDGEENCSSSPTLLFERETAASSNDICELLIKSEKSLFEPRQCSTRCHSMFWSHPHQPVLVEVTGSCYFKVSTEVEKLRSLLLYDFCRFVTQTSLQLRIQLDSELADKLINPSCSTFEEREVLDALLASVFVFLHIIKVTEGFKHMRVNYNKGKAAYVTFDKEKDQCITGPLHVYQYRMNDEDLATELELRLGSIIGTSNTMFLCVLFNEFDVNECYLTVKPIPDQTNRLPNHNTSRVRLVSAAGQLNIHITAFGHRQTSQYMQMCGVSAEEALKEFKDDRFLNAVVSVCQKFALKGAFTLECFVVPCRTTLQLMQASAEANELQDDVTEECAATRGSSTLLSSVINLHQEAAEGDYSEVTRIADTNPSLLNDLQIVFPHRTALHCAAAASVAYFSAGTQLHVECVQVLISHGADIATRDSRNQTVLHCAVLSGNAQLVRLLLKQATLDIDCRDEHGKTPLLLAVIKDRLDIVKLLLDNGADCTQSDNEELTPLTEAIKRGNADMVQAILECDSGLEDDWHRYASLYQLARDASHRDVCVLLVAQKFKLTEDNIHEAVKLSNLVCLGKFTELSAALSAGAEYNACMSAKSEFRDWRLRTPLLWAALGSWKPTAKHAKCAEVLLDAGADPNAADMDGDTALHLAAAANNTDVIRLLLDAGASVRSINRRGATPLLVARENKNEKGNNKELISMLHRAYLRELLQSWRRRENKELLISIETFIQHIIKDASELAKKVQPDQTAVKSNDNSNENETSSQLDKRNNAKQKADKTGSDLRDVASEIIDFTEETNDKYPDSEKAETPDVEDSCRRHPASDDYQDTFDVDSINGSGSSQSLGNAPVLYTYENRDEEIKGRYCSVLNSTGPSSLNSYNDDYNEPLWHFSR